eukprot:5173851-Alexandrium_andersonii.AAC.1
MGSPQDREIQFAGSRKAENAKNASDVCPSGVAHDGRQNVSRHVSVFLESPKQGSRNIIE